jgi:membrane protein DedA with SNARE-associated domain/rhodanese-related sulfurtransferase
MPNLAELLLTYGILIVFALVLIEQMGMPIPAFPILLVAGALAVGGGISWPACLLVAVLACLISDLFWFRAGRFYGKRVLRLLCKISLSPDYCVSQTEDKFKRYGVKSLLVSKFIPGFNIVASPLAGAMGTPTPQFLAFSIGGSVFWSATGLATGAVFHRSVDAALAFLSALGATAIVVVLGALAAFVLFKYVERRRFLRRVEIERIGVPELLDLIGAGSEPVLIDARSVTAREFEAAIPGALIYSDSEPAILMGALDKDRHIVVYCSCPNDVTAAQVARQFLADGFHRARPLRGGLDAWNAHHAEVKPSDSL